MLLEVKDLVAGVGNEKILDGLNLDVVEGEKYMIFGPNGAGKTTLIMLLMGSPFYKIFSGQILFRGKRIDTLSITERSKLGIGTGFQLPPEIDGVKLEDLLKIAAGRSLKEEFSEEESALIEKLKMTQFLKRDVNKGFSGGERKRSEVLQLLFMKPKLLLLDEPDSGVDIVSLKLIGSALDEYITKNNASALIVTHQGAIMEHVKATHACILLEKKGFCYRSPDSILESIRKHGYVGCIACKKKKQND
jgi:Fe-S cluster assembly ATP-binding protein